MSMIPTLLALISLLVGITAMVMAPKVWQRVIALGVVGTVVFFIAHTATIIGQKSLMAWHFSRNIRPTGELWNMIRGHLESGDQQTAEDTLELICTNWPNIGAWTRTYSAQDIVDLIQKDEDSEQPDGEATQETAPSAVP